MSGSLTVRSKKLKTGFPYFCLSSRFAVSGQPAPEDFAALAAEGFRRAVNVRSPQEMRGLDFDAARAAEENRLSYQNTPIIKDGGLDQAALETAHQLLSAAEKSGDKVFIHCASGQRAVIALLNHLLAAGELAMDSASGLAFELGLRNEALLIKLFQARARRGQPAGAK